MFFYTQISIAILNMEKVALFSYIFESKTALLVSVYHDYMRFFNKHVLQVSHMA